MIKLITTTDGSHTLHNTELDETYHSRHGAVQESNHVFLDAGFCFLTALKTKIHVLEIGFGTGLNALLTILAAQKNNTTVSYDALEAYPLPHHIVAQLNYTHEIPTAENYFSAIHRSAWDMPVQITPHFTLTKLSTSVQCFVPYKKYDLIYFDAFAPRVQPEMWTKEVFDKMYNVLNAGGLLVTYCAKGQVRRTMQSAGFKTEQLKGPPGKREMIRATKTE